MIVCMLLNFTLAFLFSNRQTFNTDTWSHASKATVFYYWPLCSTIVTVWGWLTLVTIFSQKSLCIVELFQSRIILSWFWTITLPFTHLPLVGVPALKLHLFYSSWLASLNMQTTLETHPTTHSSSSIRPNFLCVALLGNVANKKWIILWIVQRGST